MKKLPILTAASLLTILAPNAVFAADVSSPPISGHTSPYRTSNTENAYTPSRDADVKAFYFGKSDSSQFEPILIRRDRTATGIIGESIVNSNGVKIATIKDIITDRYGKAILVIAADHGFLGIGSKLAAFNYSRVLSENAQGEVVMTLSQEMVDSAADFSYDANDWAKAKIIPTDGLSVNQLLKGSVFNSNGKKVADVDNVYFRNSESTQIIMGFNRKMGMGGDLAAINFNELQMLRKNRSIDFNLNAEQSTRFENFRDPAIN
jgi:sporulation protein YlmC with PRC-barrel domain